ncbi:MAG TPA: YggS family pyridoxal phosphate-dependent enzyme [Legionella sp.]|nr:YggS family pyridoxal phosphate-dependent enzyme [Legionella sp.]
MTMAERIHSLQGVIHELEASYHRQKGSVTLLAVSKGHASPCIERAFAAGLDQFGESYLQEALVKINALPHLPICWHFVGRVQRNKAAAIAIHFSWVHGVCQIKTAQSLNDARPDGMEPLNICIQINLDDEPTKSGVSTVDVPELVAKIIQLPKVTLRGFMVIPKPLHDEKEQYHSFLRARALLHTINSQFGLTLSTLSMGMSDDFPAAIRAGSTMIRIGRAIFGSRT